MKTKPPKTETTPAASNGDKPEHPPPATCPRCGQELITSEADPHGRPMCIGVTCKPGTTVCRFVGASTKTPPPALAATRAAWLAAHNSDLPDNAPERQAARRKWDTAMHAAGVYREAARPLRDIEADLTTAEGERKTVLEVARGFHLCPTHSTATLRSLAAARTYAAREAIREQERRECEQREAEAAAQRRAEQERQQAALGAEEARRAAEAREREVRRRRYEEAMIRLAEASATPATHTAEDWPDALTIEEGARFCGCTEKTIRNRLRKVNPDGTPMLAGVTGTGRLTRIPRASLEPYRKRPSATKTAPRKRPGGKNVKRKS
jgi:hypothetical protein